MSSLAFEQLKNEILGLTTGLLPSEFQQQDSLYDETKWKENVKGYIVLSHAAFENYLEQLAIELVKNSYGLFKTTNQPNNVLVSLVLSYRINWPPVDTACADCFWRKHIIKCIGRRNSSRKMKPGVQSFDEVINNVINEYFIKDVVDGNHGAKQIHIEHIFTPLGFDMKYLDFTFITDLNNFCSIRGELAHKTTISGITTILSPVNAKANVEKLIGGKQGIWGFEEFDAAVMGLL